MATDLSSAREYMSGVGISGWLTRDYRYTNPIFFAALGYRPNNLTRPVWLWIPCDGDPRILSHEVDLKRFDVGGMEISGYRNRDEMIAGLRGFMPDDGGKVAMEYSGLYELPRVGWVDAGTVELIRSFGVDVVSSGDVSQYATER